MDFESSGGSWLNSVTEELRLETNLGTDPDEWTASLRAGVQALAAILRVKSEIASQSKEIARHRVMVFAWYL